MKGSDILRALSQDEVQIVPLWVSLAVTLTCIGLLAAVLSFAV